MSLAEFLGEEDRQSGLMIVDYSQIVISTISATFRPTEDLSVDLIRHVCLNTIRSNVLWNKRLYPTVVLATDRGPYWRKRIAPYYKGQRAKQRDDSGWNWEVIFEAMGKVREEIQEIFPYHTIHIKGVEADDIAGVLVKNLWHKYDRILLNSSDGDWAQLQKYKNVKQWSPIQKKWVTPEVSAHYHLMEKIIRGDRKDCVSSVKSVADFLLNGPEGQRQKAIRKEELEFLMTTPVENWPDEFMRKRFEENSQLLDLSRVPEDIESQIMDAFGQPVANGSRIYNYFIKHKMKELMGKVGEFV